MRTDHKRMPVANTARGCTLLLSLGLAGVRGAELEADGSGPLQEAFHTELVYPQDRGEVQLALLPRYQADGKARAFSLFTEIEYGLTERWQAGLGWDAFTWDDPHGGKSASGIGDLELSTAYSFMNVGGSPTHVGISFELGLPTGEPARQLGEGFIEFAPSLLLAREFPDWHGLTAFAQTGVAFVHRVREAGDPNQAEPSAHEFLLSGGVILPWDRWAFSLELTWRDNTWNHRGEESSLYLTPGIHWQPSPDWQLGVGVSRGLNRPSDDCQLACLLVREF